MSAVLAYSLTPALFVAICLVPFQQEPNETGRWLRHCSLGAVDLRGVLFKMLSIVLLRLLAESSSSSLIGGELTRNAKSTPTPELLNPYLHFNGFPTIFHVHSSLRSSGPEKNCEISDFLLNTTMTHVRVRMGINRSHCRDTWYLRQ